MQLNSQSGTPTTNEILTSRKIITSPSSATKDLGETSVTTSVGMTSENKMTTVHQSSALPTTEQESTTNDTLQQVRSL